MLGTPVANVRSGLRKGIFISVALLAAAFVLGFARFYLDYVLDPSLDPAWLYGYLVVFGAIFGAVLWYQAYRFNPRVVQFVEGMSGRVREADYAPWGTKKRGLMLTFDTGVLMTVARNFLVFRIVLDSGSNVLHPALNDWPTVLRGFRGATRRALVVPRKGDPQQVAELKRVAELLGGRPMMMALYERKAADLTGASTATRTAVAMFSVPKWLQRRDAVRNALDDLERLLEGLRASPIA